MSLPAGMSAVPPTPPWKKKLLRTAKGMVCANLSNAVTILAEAPELAGIFAYNELTRSVVLLMPIPGSGHRWAGARTPLRDADEIAVQQWMQENVVSGMSKASVTDAIITVSLRNTFHPFREYLDTLRWDRTKRLDSWMIECLGVADTPYNRAVGRMFVIAIVARTRKPGCKCDYMPVFEGRQGTKKSMALRVLAGDEYFSDAMPDLAHNSKDVSLHLRGKIIIEFSELSAFTKAEVTAIKKFLTQQEEKFRPPYGHNEVIEPRQCVFAGTTNDDKYLKDDTGARRVWPVETGHIDIEKLVEIRDQLFAEANTAYSVGEPHWPDEEFEAKYIKPEQDARQEENSLIEVLESWLDKQPKGEEITMSQAAMQVNINLTADRIGPFLQRKLSHALTELGWKRGSRTGGIRRWIRFEEAPQQRPYHKARKPKY